VERRHEQNSASLRPRLQHWQSLIVAALLLLVSLGQAAPSATVTTQPQAADDATPTRKVTPGTTAADDSPLSEARNRLQQAFDQLRAGDTATAQKSLQAARKWLETSATSSNSATTRQEANQLADEIAALEASLEQDTKAAESSISRYWHKATSLLQRELDQLIHRYETLSSAETTLKYLLNARMHLRNAEHSLFVVHDPGEADRELGATIGNLQVASSDARTDIRKQIAALIESLQQLTSPSLDQAAASQENRVGQYLQQALKNLEAARQMATPTEQLRLDAIIEQARQLQAEAQRKSARARYDAAMIQLRKIIDSL